MNRRENGQNTRVTGKTIKIPFINFTILNMLWIYKKTRFLRRGKIKTI
jgi:hypothetical protein